MNGKASNLALVKTGTGSLAKYHLLVLPRPCTDVHNLPTTISFVSSNLENCGSLSVNYLIENKIISTGTSCRPTWASVSAIQTWNSTWSSLCGAEYSLEAQGICFIAGLSKTYGLFAICPALQGCGACTGTA